MHPTPDVEAEARRLIDRLPKGASWDDLMFEIYVRQGTEIGSAEAEPGRASPYGDGGPRIVPRIAHRAAPPRPAPPR